MVQTHVSCMGTERITFYFLSYRDTTNKAQSYSCFCCYYRIRSPLCSLLRSLTSHPDFAPRVKAPAAAARGVDAAAAAHGAGAPAATAARVSALIASKPVVLFMKGSPSQPQCGFSAQVVRILHQHGGWAGAALACASPARGALCGGAAAQRSQRPSGRWTRHPTDARPAAAAGVEVHGEDVLKDADLRATMKEFSKWPTFPQVRSLTATQRGAATQLTRAPPLPPQLYVSGEFVGGCDIVTSMHAGGELKDLLADVPRPKLA